MQKGDSLLAHSRAQNHGLAQGWRMGWPFARSLRQQVSVLWEWWSQKNHTSSEPPPPRPVAMNMCFALQTAVNQFHATNGSIVLLQVLKSKQKELKDNPI